MSDFGRLSDTELERLRVALNLLFTESFLVRGIEHHAPSYRFVTSNFELVEKYLAIAGWGLRRDEMLGVVAFQGPPSARHSLSKDESLLLLVLRLLFEEKAGEISLHGERTVRQQDIIEKYRVLADATWKKTRYLAMLRRFQVLRLIRVVGSESDPEATVILYPSIPFALDGMAVDEAAARLRETAHAAQVEEPEQAEE
ncbi:MAG: DUF4194 domain-containing protein [Spirochaetes bacterium]|nr:DUF4194 domain-containing protein [Spirochaetota bacterium]